jgi:hypothetical protein
LFNASGSVQNLSGWRLNKAVDFTFPENTQLLADGAIVVVPFDPSNSQQVAAFRTNYGISASVVLVGPYSGVLDNGGERLELDRPTVAVGTSGSILVDRVRYDDDAPWPTNADGAGSSLTRLGAASYGNDSASWFSASPTPGTVGFEPPAVDLDNNGVVDAGDIAILCGSLNSGGPDYDVNGDNIFDIDDFYFIVRDWLRTDAGDANLDRIFNSTDLVVVFTAGEYEDAVPGNSTWAEGDWNCDGDFNTSDLVAAFQAGNYVAAATGNRAVANNEFAASRVDAKPVLTEPTKHRLAQGLTETAKSKRTTSLESVSVVDQVFADAPEFDLQSHDAEGTFDLEDVS